MPNCVKCRVRVNKCDKRDHIRLKLNNDLREVCFRGAGETKHGLFRPLRVPLLITVKSEINYGYTTAVGYTSLLLISDCLLQP